MPLRLVVKYTNVSANESVLFIEVSSIQRCPDREVPQYLHGERARECYIHVEDYVRGVCIT